MLNSRHELLGNEFYDKHEHLYILHDIIDSKDFIALYFGSWANPGCQKFTNVLESFYREVNSFQKNLEIIYVSGDRNIKEYYRHMQEVSFLSMPFQSYMSKKVRFVFNVTEIPKLVFIRARDGSVASDDGISLLYRLGP